MTVTGLVENSSVKITDVSGNLVFETTSLGGQATWDLRNYRSQRVATGYTWSSVQMKTEHLPESPRYL
ncbi:MAG: hypothetical protein R2758_13190 [Bacteroidales bacterium]